MGWSEFFAKIELEARPRLKAALAEMGWKLRPGSAGSAWIAENKSRAYGDYRETYAQALNAEELLDKVRAIESVKLTQPETWPEDDDWNDGL